MAKERDWYASGHCVARPKGRCHYVQLENRVPHTSGEVTAVRWGNPVHMT